MKCPHCNKPTDAPEVAYRNAENYGSNSFTFKCPKCGKKVGVYIQRYAKASTPVKMPDDAELSF